jgi:hypothetical protein
MYSDIERNWAEAVMTYFKQPFQIVLQGKPRNISVRSVGQSILLCPSLSFIWVLNIISESMQ